MKIGLTGGIASGKSLASKYLMDKGVPVIDADVISRQVVEPGELALNQIIQAFGREILTDEGTLDRKALGSIIFADEEKRKILNNIVHPAVRIEMKRQSDELVRAGHPLIVLDIPLLVEGELFYLVDEVWVVYVDKQTQLLRLIKRDQSNEKDAMQRIASQLPLEDKTKKADLVIDNSGSKENTYDQLDQALKRVAFT
ncbi:dephospho-CoA kinase [Shouchella patagoniensis]|uniref:dephospho-CoA kinase n=1 Tax=Shouchella patagoniensis TaxID=228576 RepID=UPI0009954BEE|nr:dephospho-CoA kinase [Shouchella patagoniensis]